VFFRRLDLRRQLLSAPRSAASEQAAILIKPAASNLFHGNHRRLFSYLIGSIPQDLSSATRGDRRQNGGSGNIGATNVARVMGKGAAS